jgi:hypothetical protein
MRHLTLCAMLLSLATYWCRADSTIIVKPGTVKAQALSLPPEETDLQQIFAQLKSVKAEECAAALQWLLRRERALELSYFQTDSIRFWVERVTRARAGEQVWRLVECSYLSKTAEQSGSHEYRARWDVVYLFDESGRLRDWVNDCDVAIARDINGDGKLELVAYIDSPKRVIVYNYQTGRSREVLRVDNVPEVGELLKRTPATGGGEVQVYEKPVTLVGDKPPLRIKVARHGFYKWDPKAESFVRE